jgi:hypothetical protein
MTGWSSLLSHAGTSDYDSMGTRRRRMVATQKCAIHTCPALSCRRRLNILYKFLFEKISGPISLVLAILKDD